jgi:AcrR family transcriptional regulator
MPPPAVDHRRAAAERSVAAILDAAERLLARGAGVSILAVAQEAGVSRPTVYAHYAKLGDLVAAVVERAVRSTVAAVASAEVDEGPALDALDRLLGAGWRSRAPPRSTWRPISCATVTSASWSSSRASSRAGARRARSGPTSRRRGW